MELDHNRAYADLWSVLERELGTRRAVEVIFEIAAAEAADDTPAEDPYYWIWRQGWKALAEERTEVFLVDPARLKPLAQPWEIAFLYARKNDPERVPPLPLTAVEEALLVRGRELLFEITGLRSFRRPCANYLIEHAAIGVGAALSLWQLHDTEAITMDAFSYLRRNNAFPRWSVDARRKADPSGASLVSLVLHEESHVALNVACNRNPRRWQAGRAQLVKVVEEAAVRATEAAIQPLVAGSEEMPVEVERPVQALLAAVGHPADPRDAIARAMEVGVVCARSASDEDALALLNARSRRRWSRRRWLAELAVDMTKAGQARRTT